MDTINVNKILNRCAIKEKITEILDYFEKNKQNLLTKRGIYIYGNPGSGKSHFIKEILKELDYDMIVYDAGDIRNKSIIDTITKHNMSDQNILSMFYGKSKKIAIVMDEIDGMNSGDKGGINSLIKLIRPKKTKKQKLEDVTLNPIICIGNYHIDKKIKELMKVCNVYELKTPTKEQTKKIISLSYPSLNNNYQNALLNYAKGDLRKLHSVFDLLKTKNNSFDESILNMLQLKNFNDDAKNTTQMLINNLFPLEKHNKIINETDRTIIALLWHENIVDTFSKYDLQKVIPVYNKILKQTCFADYIDRITFQNQIWQFNEMSSLIKTFYNNKIYHENFPENTNKYNPEEVRFTKVLTKYSTEYNNMLFIYSLCQELEMEKKDVISFFQELRLYYDEDISINQEILLELEGLFENYNISKLDIKRMYRYLDKNIKKDAEDIED